ncbi:MAG: TIGR04282 family arsenosugar biosynthesis glycosyltransferase [Acidobacteria bacterium]|nr:TIGR04282 family arsenosugar biosynthesis glycosyltransferase [Acidobacteriota bacterium]
MKKTYPILDRRAPPVARRGSCALAMMIKAPRAGASKTRLVPPLAPDEAAALSVCFLRDTTANIADVVSQGGATGIAVYTPVGAEAAFDGLLPETFSLLAQRGESFGDRLFYAAEDLLMLGYESLCLIDSDSPTLPSALLAEAVATLSRPGERVVLGAAEDGGYYLIGLKSAHRHLFTDIEWSTTKVLSQTIERAAGIKLEVEVLPAWYDVDDAVTLRHLCEELFGMNGQRTTRECLSGYAAPHTRDYLARLIEREGRERIWPSMAASGNPG